MAWNIVPPLILIVFFVTIELGKVPAIISKVLPDIFPAPKCIAGKPSADPYCALPPSTPLLKEPVAAQAGDAEKIFRARANEAKKQERKALREMFIGKVIIGFPFGFCL